MVECWVGWPSASLGSKDDKIKSPSSPKQGLPYLERQRDPGHRALFDNMGGDGTAKAKKKQKKAKSKSRIRSDDGSDLGGVGSDGIGSGDLGGDGRRAESSTAKVKKKKKKKKRRCDNEDEGDGGDFVNEGLVKRRKKKRRGGEESANDIDSGGLAKSSPASYFPFEYEHIVAPMVGASELAFRLLCRKYGASLAYTPMMSAKQFVKEASEADLDGQRRTVSNSDICDFQTIPEDRPLVCHFSANDPRDFASAAKLVENVCDAIDLNLGCPQRTAYLVRSRTRTFFHMSQTNPDFRAISDHICLATKTAS